MSTAARCPLVRRSLFRSSVCAFSGERALHERPVVARSAMLFLRGMCVRFYMVAVLGTGMGSSVASVDPELTANPLRFWSSAAGSNATCTDDDAHRRCDSYASECCERQDCHGLDRIGPRTIGGSAGGIAYSGAAAGSTLSARWAPTMVAHDGQLSRRASYVLVP